MVNGTLAALLFFYMWGLLFAFEVILRFLLDTQSVTYFNMSAQ